MSSYAYDFSIRRLWIIFGVGMVVMFGALLFFGVQIYHAKPPIPGAVRTASGQILYTSADIQRGQSVWQSIGGMQQGSIWGHGSYVAPDWSADWLHREAVALRDGIAGTDPRTPFEALPEPDQARFGSMLKREMRTNTYDPRTTDIYRQRSVVPPPSRRPPRITATCLPTARPPTSNCASSTLCRRTPCCRAKKLMRLTGFIFWTAWATATERPGDTISYTSNWPHEPLVGNTPPGSIFLWTFISIFVLAWRDRRARLVLCARVRCVAARHRADRGLRGDRRPRRGDDHPIDAGDREIFLRGHGLVLRPGVARHRHRALRGRRTGPLRPADGGIFPLCRYPHLAHAARGACGSRPPGSPPASMSPRCSAAGNRSSSASASTSCSSACW